MFVTVLTETRIDRKRMYRGLPVFTFLIKIQYVAPIK
jgi:hypothetical protein